MGIKIEDLSADQRKRIVTPRRHHDELLSHERIAVKPPKYRNVRVEVNGEKFDSKREAGHWLALKARQDAGEIYNLRRQVKLQLECPDKTVSDDGVFNEVAFYVADFVYQERPSGKLHIVDAKGVRTQMYRLKKKWLELQEGWVIEEV